MRADVVGAGEDPVNGHSKGRKQSIIIFCQDCSASYLPKQQFLLPSSRSAERSIMLRVSPSSTLQILR
jgi:hypothetical protein